MPSKAEWRWSSYWWWMDRYGGGGATSRAWALPFEAAACWLSGSYWCRCAAYQKALESKPNYVRASLGASAPDGFDAAAVRLRAAVTSSLRLAVAASESRSEDACADADHTKRASLLRRLLHALDGLFGRP